MNVQSFGGSWTREKLEILRRYLDAYTTALKNRPFNLIYVDAFAGPGSWRPGSSYSQDHYREFTEMLKGSPSIALDVDDRPFDRLIFIDTDPEHIEALGELKISSPTRSITIVQEDANLAIPELCSRLSNRDRAVVFVDPYATQVSWSTIQAIASTQKIDCWILFPLMAIARLLPLNREPDAALAQRLDRIFGGREYWYGFYSPLKQPSFWSQGDEQERESGSGQIAIAYRERLVSAFEQVAPTRRVLKNSQNSDLFDLFFAASNPRGAEIAVGIADYILGRW